MAPGRGVGWGGVGGLSGAARCSGGEQPHGAGPALTAAALRSRPRTLPLLRSAPLRARPRPLPPTPPSSPPPHSAFVCDGMGRAGGGLKERKVEKRALLGAGRMVRGGSPRF